MKIKVLYLDSPIDPPGGGQMSLLQLLKNLDKNSFEALVLLDDHCGFSKMLEEAGIPWAKAGYSAIMSYVKTFKPHVIHCNAATDKYAFIAAVCAKLAGVPFVWHNRVLQTAGWKERLIAALASKILVISDAVGAKFYGYGNKVVRVHNFTDCLAFTPSIDVLDLRNKMGFSPESRVIGVFSRLVPWKGHELFFWAAAILMRELPGMDIRFLIAGYGPEKERLSSFAADIGLGGRTIFTGFRLDIPSLMNVCDIIVNPSVEPEPFGRTIIEAMACGKPVVATVGGGASEIVSDGVDGLLVRAEPGMMAHAIRSLLPGGKLNPAQFGMMARRKAVEMFSGQSQMEIVGKVYRDLSEAR